MSRALLLFRRGEEQRGKTWVEINDDFCGEGGGEEYIEAQDDHFRS